MDEVSSEVIRLLRDTHHGGRPGWPNFDTTTTGAQYRILHRLCERWIPKGASVLDWGSGNGHASMYLTRSGFDVTAFSFEPFHFGDLLGPAPFRFVGAGSDDPVRLPFESGSFDAVLSVGVLEHVRETGGEEAASLAEIRRVLRPGGVMICTHFPNAGSWIEAVLRRRGGTHVHQYRYTHEEVERLFRTAGFHVVRHGRYGALPRNQVARFFPRAVCDSVLFSRLFGGFDAVLSALIPWFVQNHYIVAIRPAAG